jgi:hypothetical protein
MRVAAESGFFWVDQSWESAFSNFYFYFTSQKSLSKSPRESGDFVYCELPY